MDGKEIKPEQIGKSMMKIFEKLDALEVSVNARFDKLKEALIDYVSLGSDMMRGSVIATLKNI